MQVYGYEGPDGPDNIVTCGAMAILPLNYQMNPTTHHPPNLKGGLWIVPAYPQAKQIGLINQLYPLNSQANPYG